MRSKLYLALVMTAAVIALSGCTTTVGMIPTEDLYPKALTFCADDPKVPARPAPGKPRTDEQKADYIKNLHGAYVDCSDTVAGWRDRRAKYDKQYTTVTKGYFTRLWDAITDNGD
jgi:hypothetical protein